MARHANFFKLNYRKVRKLSKTTETVTKSAEIVIHSADVRWCSMKKRNKAEDLICTTPYSMNWRQTKSTECTVLLLLWDGKRQYLTLPSIPLAISKIRCWRCKMIPCSEPEGAFIRFHWMNLEFWIWIDLFMFWSIIWSIPSLLFAWACWGRWNVKREK